MADVFTVERWLSEVKVERDRRCGRTLTEDHAATGMTSGIACRLILCVRVCVCVHRRTRELQPNDLLSYRSISYEQSYKDIRMYDS